MTRTIEREQIFTSREQINEVVKEIEKLMTLGLEGQEYQARGVDYHLAFPNIFSSAGCWILVYPHQQIEEAFALRSGADWIDERPLKKLDAQIVDALVSQRFNDFLNQTAGLRDIPGLSRNAEASTAAHQPGTGQESHSQPTAGRHRRCLAPPA